MRTNQQITNRGSKQVHLGFSIRQAPQESGQKPICQQGCKQAIQYADHSCVKHNHNKRISDKYLTLDQYHCKVDCLIKLKDKHLAEFLAKTPRSISFKGYDQGTSIFKVSYKKLTKKQVAVLTFIK